MPIEPSIATDDPESRRGSGVPSIDEQAILRLMAERGDLAISGSLPTSCPGHLHYKGVTNEGQEVSIHIYAPLPSDPLGRARLAAGYERVERLAEVSDPSLAEVVDFGDLAGHLLVIQASTEAPTLRQCLRTSGKFERQQALRTTENLASALAVFHGTGIVHGSLTPDSLCLLEDGRVVLTDLGLQRMISGRRPGLADPDRAYEAPETSGLTHEPKPETADVFSLGIIAYELLCGQLPGPFADLPSQCSGSGKWLDDVIFIAQHHDPEKRYPTIAAFQQAMMAREEKLMDLDVLKKIDVVEKAQTALPLGQRHRAKQTIFARRWGYVGLVGLVLAIVAASLFVGQRVENEREEMRVATVEAVKLFGLLVSAYTNGDDEEKGRILRALAALDPEVQLTALQKVTAELSEEGRYAEALAIVEGLVEVNVGKRGGAFDRMRRMAEDMTAALDQYRTHWGSADIALMKQSFVEELAELEAAREVYPNSRELQLRIDRNPIRFEIALQAALLQLAQLNPAQTDWHVSYLRSADKGNPLLLDLSDHAKLHDITPILELPITGLDLSHTEVDSLESLSKLALRVLRLDGIGGVDLRPVFAASVDWLSAPDAAWPDGEEIDEESFRLLKIGGDWEAYRMPPILPSEPWENMIGMSFRSLRNARLLLGCAEVRLKDYNHFRRSREEEPIEGLPTMPVVVSEAEATAFGRWLTKEGLRLGHLAGGMRYRLPTRDEMLDLAGYCTALPALRQNARSQSATDDRAGMTVEPGSANSEEAIRPVARGACEGGFFDVRGNAEEWLLTSDAKRDDGGPSKGFRLVLELPPEEP